MTLTAGLAALGCGPSLPDTTTGLPTTGAALVDGDGTCEVVPSRGTPLVIDWQSQHRTDLEEAMRGGVAVVAYSCEKLELLPDCHIAGDYGFMGTSMKEDLIHLQGSKEIKVNLPAGMLDGEIRDDTKLDLGLVQIGKLRSARRFATKDLLREASPNACAGATHFVRGAYVGAFALTSATSGTVRDASDVFGIGSSAQATSAEKVSKRDGDLEACAKAQRDAEAPPPGCEAVLRLEVKGILAEVVNTDVPEQDDFVDCPAGTVLADGKCAAPDAQKPHVCASDDAADCERQCAAGEPQSCGRLAFMAHYGTHGQTTDPRRAATLYEQGCQGGDAFSCAGLAIVLQRGLGGRKPDLQRAVELNEGACDTGEPRGCNNLATIYDEGLLGAPDPNRAFGLYQRACAGGWASACGNVGTLYESGRGGVAKDVDRANQIYEAACRDGDGGGCTNLGNAYFKGRGVTLDEAKAGELYELGCRYGAGRGCFFHGEILEAASAAGSAACSAYRRGCDLGDGPSCRASAACVDEAAVHRPAKIASALVRACALGDAPGCIGLSDLVIEGKLEASLRKKAQRYLEETCATGQAAACHGRGRIARLGVAEGRPPSLDDAIAWMKKGCALYDAGSCDAYRDALREAGRADDAAMTWIAAHMCRPGKSCDPSQSVRPGQFVVTADGDDRQGRPDARAADRVGRPHAEAAREGEVHAPAAPPPGFDP